MKIVHVSHLYYPSTGGVQYWFKNVSERLVKDYGDDVTMVTTNSLYGPERKIFRRIEPAEETINGVKIIRFPFKRRHIKPLGFARKIIERAGFKTPDILWQMLYGPHSQRMKNYLASIDADVICASSSNYSFMQLPLWKQCRFFYFGSIHLSEQPNGNDLSKVQLQSINASYRYLANTVFERNRLSKAGVQKDKIAVLGVGVEPALFNINQDAVVDFKTNLKLPGEALVVGYIGRIEATKSISVLIKAFENIAAAQPNIHLLIAGSGGDYAEELKDYCDKLNPSIASKIHWKINFMSAEKALLFHALDILVLPSNNESFGIVFLEAWMCKKPVIGAAIGAVKDVITENVDGLIMNIDDDNDLANKLLKLAGDKPLREKFGNAGYEKVVNNYTWDIITKRLRDYYQQAMKDLPN